MKIFPIDNGMLNSTYDYSKLIKMQSEEVSSKVSEKGPTKKMIKKKTYKEGPKRKRIS